MCRFKNQRGVVLVIGLLMLSIITIVGVTTMNSVTINERMAANHQFETISFQAAESAIHRVLRPSKLTPAFKASPTKLSPDSLNYSAGLEHVNQQGNMTAPVIQTTARIISCNEVLGMNSIKSKLRDRVYDIYGSGQIAGIGSEEHLMRVRHLSQNEYGKNFDDAACRKVE